MLVCWNIPPSPSPTESKSSRYISFMKCVKEFRGPIYHMSSTKGKANQRFFQCNYGHSILLKPFLFTLFLRFWFPMKWKFLIWHSVTRENMSLAYLILLHTVHGVLILFMGLKAGREGDDRGWDGWIASLTWRTWIWVSSRSWWWTGKPGMLQSMGSQRVGHNWIEYFYMGFLDGSDDKESAYNLGDLDSIPVLGRSP